MIAIAVFWLLVDMITRITAFLAWCCRVAILCGNLAFGGDGRG
jgi:hypothetical protein